MSQSLVTLATARPFSLELARPFTPRHTDPSESCIENLRNKIADLLLPRNPVTKEREFRLLPEWFERGLGQLVFSIFVRIKGESKQGQALLTKVTRKLVAISDRPFLNYEVKVIKNFGNAACFIGGKFIFGQKLVEELACDINSYGVGHFTLEEKVAAIMSHELIHAAAGHSVKMAQYVWLGSISMVTFLEGIITRILSIAKVSGLMGIPVGIASALLPHYFLLPKMRQYELEADRYGMEYLKRAGYNPKVALWMNKHFLSEDRDKPTRWFETHPSFSQRLKCNRITLKQIEKGGFS